MARFEKVCITGAGNGLGREIALKIAASCFLLVDIDLDGLSMTQKMLRDLGTKAEIVLKKVDLSSKVEIERFVKTNEFRKCSVLINNAGIMAANYFESMNLESFEKTVQVNFLAHVQLTQAFLKANENREVSIVGICSLMSHLHSAGLTDYCSSKAAAKSFYDCLRMELKRNHKDGQIHVLVICPYILNTNLFKNAFEDSGTYLWIDQLRNYMFPPLTTTSAAECIVQSLKKKHA